MSGQAWDEIARIVAERDRYREALDRMFGPSANDGDPVKDIEQWGAEWSRYQEALETTHTRPLGEEATVQTLDDGATTVHSAPGYMVFIERRRQGDYQQIPVDPEHIEELIVALRVARAEAASA